MENLEFKGERNGASATQSNMTYSCFLLLQCILSFVMVVLQSDRPSSLLARSVFKRIFIATTKGPSSP